MATRKTLEKKVKRSSAKTRNEAYANSTRDWQYEVPCVCVPARNTLERDSQDDETIPLAKRLAHSLLGMGITKGKSIPRDKETHFSWAFSSATRFFCHSFRCFFASASCFRQDAFDTLMCAGRQWTTGQSARLLLSALSVRPNRTHAQQNKNKSEHAQCIRVESGMGDRDEDTIRQACRRVAAALRRGPVETQVEN